MPTLQEVVLGRDEIRLAFPSIRGKKFLVTGGNGSIGSLLCETIKSHHAVAQSFDLPRHSVISEDEVEEVVKNFMPDAVFHLAADKYATDAEIHPHRVATLNIEGTENVIRACFDRGIPLVLASTCKAAQPETVYGASKLIAERMVLNSDGYVCRFYNCIDTIGNVFELWKAQIAEGIPLTVVDECQRYFITRTEAVSLLLASLTLAQGRYALTPGEPLSMAETAARVASWARHEAGVRTIKRRRGDRIIEPLVGANERTVKTALPHVVRIVNSNDLI